MARVLIVEDEPDLRQVLRFNVEQAGHEALEASTGSEGLRLALERSPELILLDLMLPDILGTEVCSSLKKQPETQHIPVIMLTARGEERDRVSGFESGADDYVTKPFSVRELLLRVEAVLRRSGAQSRAAETQRIVFGALRIDVEAHRVWVSDVEVELSALEFKLLTLLHERRDRVQTRGALLDSVWGVTADVTTRTVDTHVKRLREKLGIARSYIETVRGVGYRFLAKPTPDK